MRFALIALLAGCSVDYEKRPGQDVVERIIWHDTYGMTDDPPRVGWLHVDSWGDNIKGETFPWEGVVVACGVNCDWTWGYTRIAHEFMHYKIWETTQGNLDPEHSRSEDWELVPAAMEAVQNEMPDQVQVIH